MLRRCHYGPLTVPAQFGSDIAAGQYWLAFRSFWKSMQRVARDTGRNAARCPVLYASGLLTMYDFTFVAQASILGKAGALSIRYRGRV